jgi:hypothetical protein
MRWAEREQLARNIAGVIEDLLQAPRSRERRRELITRQGSWAIYRGFRSAKGWECACISSGNTT